MSCETAIYIRVVDEEAADGGDGFMFTLHGRNAQEVPAPVVYVDGEEADPAEYEFDYGTEGGEASITFTESRAGRSVTCDYVWKYECGADEELSVYEMGRELNVRMLKDVNGRTMLVESRIKTTGWRGLLVWRYMSREFWEEMKTLAESGGYTFDLERNSLGGELKMIRRLYVVKYPRYEERPGLPGLTDVELEVVQVEAAE